MSYLKIFFEAFRFLKRWRERRAAELAAERDHQIRLIEAQTKSIEIIVESALAQSRENAAALIEVAKSTQAQAAGFNEWIKLFHVAAAPQEQPSLMHDEEQSDSFAELAQAVGPVDPASIPAELPEELRLAFALQRGPNSISALAEKPPL